MKNCLLLIALVSASAFGQVTMICYDKNDKPADEAQAEYCVVGKFIEFQTLPFIKETQWQFVDTVRAYYTATKRLKFLKIFDADGFETGNYIEYHPDGKIKERGYSHRGKKVGLITTNYPSGKPNFTLKYFPDSLPVANPLGNYTIQSYYDEKGQQLVKNGDGMCNCSFNTTFHEVGRVREGLRDSIWSAYNGDTLLFSESYHEGKFIDGIRYYDGMKFRYTNFEEPPSYQGGYEAIMEVLRKNMRFPASARRKGADGTVYVSFIVRNDGSMTDMKVLRGFDSDCDKEALRVVALLDGKWNPGRQRGKPVNVRFNLPVKFKLN